MIYINARFLTQPISGVQRFAIELCRQLKKTDYSDRFQLVSPVNIIHSDIAHELQVIKTGRNSGHLWEQYDLPKFLKKHGNPLLINLANAAPVLYNRNIVTIHDLSIYQNPAWFSFAYRTFYRAITPLIIQRALKIITVSNSVKEEIMGRFSLPADKLYVIYNGISKLFLEEKPSCKKENYLLTVSSIDPRKNLGTLIKAFTKAAIPDYQLYIIGGKASAFSGSDLENEIKENGNIKLLGRVSDEELARLYSQARLFVYLSLYEGFGIPNIEAMAMGVPVLTSGIRSIREVCGEAAFYTDPLNVDEVAENIKKLVMNREELRKLADLGLQQSNLYRWENAAQKLLNLVIHDGSAKG
jgi:glycosyltransferase involved in cell wall biosynthesis